MKIVTNREPRLPVSQRILLSMLILFVATEVFNGALRYAYAQMGMPWLNYAPKILIAVMVLGNFFKACYRGRIQAGFAMLFIVLFCSSLVGFYFTQNIYQVMFAWFAFIPLILGIMVGPVVRHLDFRLLYYVGILLWLCAASGVVYDYYVDVPWSGFNFEFGGHELQSSRKWWAYGGTERVSGFTRASFDVAVQLLYLAIPIVLLGRSIRLKSVIWIVTGVLIVATTTKKTAGVYATLTLLLPLLNLQIVPPQIRNITQKITPWLIVMVGIYLPLSTLLIDYSLKLEDDTSLFLFTSFEDRLTWMWPQCFELVFRYGSPIFGRGFSGIGVAQSYFEPGLYNSADNMYLYFYAVFGIAALPFIGYYTRCIAQLRATHEIWARLIWAWAVGILMNGWATNGVEGGFTSLLLGVTFEYARLVRR